MFSIRFIVFILLIFTSLKLYSQEDKLLLNKYFIKFSAQNLSYLSEEAEQFVQQKPNRKTLGIFNLRRGIFVATHKSEKQGWLQKIGETIGEEPVFFDALKTRKSVLQLKQFMINKGFYNADVQDSIIIFNNKVNVVFTILPGTPCKITHLKYTIQDTMVERIIARDSSSFLLKTGMNMDVTILQNERERLTNLLKNAGFYDFSKEYIYFIADTLGSPNCAKLELVIKSPHNTQHQQYMVEKIILYPDFDAKASLVDPIGYQTSFDTLQLDITKNIFVIKNKKLRLKPATILRENYIEINQLYNQENIKKTYQQLMSLPALKLVNISFSEDTISKTQKNGYKSLECRFQLTPSVFQSYNLELEGSNTSGNFGFAANLVYQNKNLFKGAENLFIRFRSAFETQTEGALTASSATIFNTYEYGGEANLNIPKFLFLTAANNFSKKYNLKTNISVIYNFQNRPDFIRTIANLALGYSWKGKENSHFRYFLNAFDLNFINVRNETERFKKVIDSLHIGFSYENQLISSVNFGLAFDNQIDNKKSGYLYFRTNIEVAGLLPGLYANVNTSVDPNTYRKILNTRYAQYFKSEFDFRFYQPFINKNKLVYRCFAGIAIPYGNSEKGLPFVKKYYSGGSNSLRAWQVRSLGPGTYTNSSHIFNNQTGDIKLEFNLEYRNKLFWVLEGAVFLDVGNIWAINKYDERDGAQFSKNFTKELAVGSGFGLRLDFSYFIIRLDLGMKLKDPSESTAWIFQNRSFRRADFAANFGIGYPF